VIETDRHSEVGHEPKPECFGHDKTCSSFAFNVYTSLKKEGKENEVVTVPLLGTILSRKI